MSSSEISKLTVIADQAPQMQCYINLNANKVIKAIDYIDMIINESADAWEDLDQEERREYNDQFKNFSCIYSSR